MNKTWILFKDELNGFAKSSVMIGMWIGMPALGIFLYFIMPSEILSQGPIKITASSYIALILSSLASTLASIMVAIEIVNEKNRKIYDLFVIRPINRGHLMLAKFFAVMLCVAIALAISLFAGLLIDMAMGVDVGPLKIESIIESYISTLGVMAVGTAGGILVGVISNSVLMAVMLIWLVTQNFVIIPMIPGLIGLPDYLWVAMAITLVITVVLMTVALQIFKRMDF